MSMLSINKWNKFTLSWTIFTFMKNRAVFSSFPLSKSLCEDSHSDFKLIGFGLRHCRVGVEQIIPNIYNSGKHYSLIFNHDKVKVNINGDETELSPFTLFVWDNESCIVKYGTPGTQWHISWLQFSGSTLEQAMMEYGVKLNSPVRFNGERLIRAYWETFYDELYTTSRPDSRLLIHFITGILLELNRLMCPLENKTLVIPESFLELKHYIENHYKEKLNLAGLAARIHLAPVYLSRKFKEYFGVGPVDYVILLRLNNAALYLRNSQISIKEVAARSGYSDSLYFSRLFKKHMGQSPEKYRDKLISG